MTVATTSVTCTVTDILPLLYSVRDCLWRWKLLQFR